MNLYVKSEIDKRMREGIGENFGKIKYNWETRTIS